MPRYYRRDGTPYPRGRKGLLEWAMDFENEKLRQVIAEELPGGTLVSTIWIGIDYDWTSLFQNLPHVPMIFETMVFDPKGEPIECQRWRTENDAIAGHVEMVDKMLAKSRAKKN